MNEITEKEARYILRQPQSEHTRNYYQKGLDILTKYYPYVNISGQYVVTDDYQEYVINISIYAIIDSGITKKEFKKLSKLGWKLDSLTDEYFAHEM